MVVVPVEGIEPPLLAEHDFESCASTSSATRACGAIYIRRPARRAKRKSRPHGGLASASKIGQLLRVVAGAARRRGCDDPDFDIADDLARPAARPADHRGWRGGVRWQRRDHVRRLVFRIRAKTAALPALP